MKKINEIKGLLLSNKQMQSLKGGAPPCGTICGIEGHADWTCGTNAMGSCVCNGWVNNVMHYATCTNPNPNP